MERVAWRLLTSYKKGNESLAFTCDDMYVLTGIEQSNRSDPVL